MARILITGAAGFIGSHTADLLLASGHDVLGIDNFRTGREANLAKASRNPRFRLLREDITTEGLLIGLVATEKPDAILHLAALVSVPESIADPVLNRRLNLEATRLVTAAAAASGSVRRIAFASSAAVYGANADLPLHETAQTKPLSPYGEAKLESEKILADLSRSQPAISTVALRYFNVAGADPQGRVGQSTANASHLIKTAVRAALGFRSGMEVFGTDYPTPDGSCVRDFIHVTDLVRAHLDALRYLRAGGESVVCNCGYQTGYSVLEVIEVVKSVAGVDFPVRLSGRRLGDSASVIADNTRIKSLLGWKPIHADLRAMIAQSLAWERRLHNRAA